MIAGYGEFCAGWRVRGFLAGSKIFLVASKRPNHFWATPSFLLNGNLGGLSPALKATTTRSRSRKSIWCHDKEWVEFYLHSHCVLSWRGQGQIYLQKFQYDVLRNLKNTIHIFRWAHNISTYITLILYLNSEENSS